MAKAIAKASKGKAGKAAARKGKADPVKADPRKVNKGKAVAKPAERSKPTVARECAIGVQLAPGQMQGTGVYIQDTDKVVSLPKDNPGKGKLIAARWAATLAYWRKRKGKPATVADLLAVNGGLHRNDLRHWASKGFVKIGGKVEWQ